jgi:NADPH-dependent glutamate synthase beta subunit-like oxidoreductase
MPSFSELVNQILGEVAPKGWEGTVKDMKDEPGIDNPWALAHWMKGEGYKSHKKEAGGDEPFAGDRSMRATTASDKQSLSYSQTDPVRVIVTHGSGTTSGKTGTVVSPREVKTDGRGIPTNIQGAYHPVDWDAEVSLLPCIRKGSRACGSKKVVKREIHTPITKSNNDQTMTLAAVQIGNIQLIAQAKKSHKKSREKISVVIGVAQELATEWALGLHMLAILI